VAPRAEVGALCGMRCLSYIFVAVGFLAGCAHPSNRAKSDPRVSTDAQPRTILVYVGGAVNGPGKLNLGPPFTIEHALQQAGGLDQFEKNGNRKVIVHLEGHKDVRVPRKDYDSFILRDGESVWVPRH
jgi:hypothetical protein